MPTAASHQYVAVYRVDGPEVANVWRDAAPLGPEYVNAGSLLISPWESRATSTSVDQASVGVRAVAASMPADAPLDDRELSNRHAAFLSIER